MKTAFTAWAPRGVWFLVWAMLALAWTPGARAQISAGALLNGANKPTVEACVREISGDSVTIFFNTRYYLTPVACADIRRHTHLLPNGDFNGETWDYNIADNRLLFRLRYEQGQRHGRYESFYRNGHTAAQGQFTKGEPTGIWEFWYANGQRKQTFEWTGKLNPRLRILASWDSTGQPGVTNGNGLWQGVMPTTQRRYGGPVVAGLPQGVWESRAVSTGKLLTTEVYEEGIFKGGKALDAGSQRYKKYSLLEPSVADPTAFAEQVRLGITCEAMQAVRQHRTAPLLPSQALPNAHVAPPKPPGDVTSYLHQLLDNLSQTNQRNQWENMVDGQQFVVKATVDTKGYLRLVSGQGGSGIVTAMSQAVGGMGRWQPATKNDQPVAGTVSFLVVKAGARLNISMQTSAF